MLGFQVPVFRDGSLLTSQMLEKMKEYSVQMADQLFSGYCNGIISGGEVTGNRDILYLSKTLVRFQDKLIFLPDRLEIPIHPTGEIQVVKLLFHDTELGEEFEKISMEVLVTSDTEKNRNMIEICRFCLQPGAEIRCEFEDFSDLTTEYDTIHYLYSDWSGYTKNGIHPKILKEFYKQIRYSGNKEPVDHSFILQFLSNMGRCCDRNPIIYYINEKTGKTEPDYTNDEIYEELKNIIRDMKRRVPKSNKQKEERRLIVD